MSEVESENEKEGKLVYDHVKAILAVEEDKIRVASEAAMNLVRKGEADALAALDQMRKKAAADFTIDGMNERLKERLENMESVIHLEHEFRYLRIASRSWAQDGANKETLAALEKRMGQLESCAAILRASAFTAEPEPVAEAVPAKKKRGNK